MAIITDRKAQCGSDEKLEERTIDLVIFRYESGVSQ